MAEICDELKFGIPFDFYKLHSTFSRFIYAAYETFDIANLIGGFPEAALLR